MSKLWLPRELHPDFMVPGRKPVGPIEVDWNKAPSSMRAAIPFSDAQGVDNLAYPEVKFAVAPDATSGVDIIGNMGVLTSTKRIGHHFVHEEIIPGVTNRNGPLYGPLTCFAVMAYDHAPKAYNDQTFFSAGSSSSSDAFLYFDNLGTKGRMTAFNAGSSAKVAIASPELSYRTDDYFTAATTITIDSRTIYQNGGTLAGGEQNADTRKYSYATSNVLNFFDTTDATRRPNGRIALLLLFNEVLTDAQIASLHLDPWQYFRPQQLVFLPESIDGGVEPPSLLLGMIPA